MAVSFIDRYYSGHMNATANAITMTIPAGAQSGDMMLAYLHQSENTSAGVWDDDGGGGNGWTRLAYNRTTGGRDMETAVYYKVHDGSESNPTFTHGLTEPMSGSLLVYRGVQPGAPVVTYANAQNDGNPPNPSSTIVYGNATVICCHSQSHDDVTASAPPTGFTFRTDGWINSTADHMNHYIADINSIGVGAYTPPDWQHTVANTTPEYHTYTIVLEEAQAIGIETKPNVVAYGNTGKVITGFGFEATQGTGKVELWSNTSGTIKTTQTITSWSDTSITFSVVQGSLPDNTTIYIVVANDSGDVTPTSSGSVGVGLLPYSSILTNQTPDHWWSFDNTYDDLAGSIPATSQTQGGGGTFVTTPISDNSTHSWYVDSGIRREPANSNNMNGAVTYNRLMGGWFMKGAYTKALECIYEEGGGVNNLAFFIGMGNTLVAQLADTGDDNVQAFSDIVLAPNRPYHIAFRFSYTDITKEFRLYLDGILQANTSGNPLTAPDLDGHSGDISFGGNGAALEVAGTNVDFTDCSDSYYSNWVTWSESKPQSDITELFLRGALPKYTVESDTEAAMQSDLDTQLQDSTVENYPIGLRINGTGDITLTANNINFNPLCTHEIEWRGSGELTWVVGTGSNIDESKCVATNGGTFVFEYPATLIIEGLINNSEVRIYDNEIGGSSYGTELAGTEVNSGTTFSYSHDGSSNAVIIQTMIDGYEENIVPVTLGSSDQTVTLFQKVDLNK